MSIASSVCACCGAAAKYRCPGCGATTCSLACSQRHKQRPRRRRAPDGAVNDTADGNGVEDEDEEEEEDEDDDDDEDGPCSGKRRRFTFLRRSEMSDATLRDDVAFLLETDAAIHRPPLVGDAAARPPPQALGARALHASASARGVRLYTLAAGMSRRRANTTSLRAGVLHWRVEWRVVALAAAPADEAAVAAALADGRAATHIDAAAAETARLCDLAATHLGGARCDDAVAVWRLVEFEQPRDERGAPPLQRVGDTTQTLRALLAGAAVVEWPIFVVVVPPERRGGDGSGGAAP